MKRTKGHIVKQQIISILVILGILVTCSLVLNNMITDTRIQFLELNLAPFLTNFFVIGGCFGLLLLLTLKHIPLWVKNILYYLLVFSLIIQLFLCFINLYKVLYHY